MYVFVCVILYEILLYVGRLSSGSLRFSHLLCEQDDPTAVVVLFLPVCKAFTYRRFKTTVLYSLNVKFCVLSTPFFVLLFP